MPLVDKVVHFARPDNKPYTLCDGNGLSLFVACNGRRSWHFRFSWQKKQYRISLGVFPEVSLEEARALCRDSNELLGKGIDPRVYRQQTNSPAADSRLFRVFVRSWLAFKLKRLDSVFSREKKHVGGQVTAIQIERSLKRDILPFLGDRTLRDISREDVWAIQQRIEQRGTFAVAKKVRTWLKEMFAYAVALGELELNPASYLNELALPCYGKRMVNPFLSLEEIHELLSCLARYRGNLQTRLAIRLLLLTGVRLAHLRFAQVQHFDFKLSVWHVDVFRGRKVLENSDRSRLIYPAYVVPLSSQALSIVKKLCECAFPGQKYLLCHRLDPQQTISENTLNMALKRLGISGRLTSHGIRKMLFAAFKNLGYDDDLINTQLYHFSCEEIRRTYNHALYIEQRRTMMQEWADLLDAWEKEEQFKVVY